MAVAEATASGGPAVWRPGGRPDPSRVAAALGECGRKVVIDLSAYAPADTSDLGALVGGVRQFHDEGGRAVFLCPRAGTRVVLESTGIDRIVPVVSDLQAAADELAKNA